MQATTKQNPRAVHKGNDSKAVLVWFPRDLAEKMDRAVVDTDTDRSKFIRHAVRIRLSTLELAAAK